MSPSPRAYPVGLDLLGRRVVVVGGGSVAERRVPVLLDAGAAVHVVSPELTDSLAELAERSRLTWVPRRYELGDLDGAWYAVAATRDGVVNAAVAAEAESQQTFCVRSDAVTSGSANTPAVLRTDDVTVAVLSGDRACSSEVRRAVERALSTSGAGARSPEARKGTVALVGGGPGADDLLTLRGLRLIHEADVVVADRLAPQSLLGELRPDVEIVDAAKNPYGKAMPQEEINAVLVDRARAGKFVVRLKGGDPFLYGRGFEEAIACAEAGVDCVVVPGVTSALSVPALAGIPVTHRGVTHELTVVSGHLAPTHPGTLVDWDALGRMRGTTVVLMGVKNAAAIADALMAAGKSPQTPAAVIADGSLDGQVSFRCTLGTLGEQMLARGVQPPAIYVVGEVAGLPDALGATGHENPPPA